MTLDPRLQRLIEQGNEEDIIRGIIRLKNELIYPPKIKVITQFGDIITCRLRRADITEVHDHTSVFSFKAPRYYFPDYEINYLKEPIPFTGSNIPAGHPGSFNGRKVYVGIIDYGIDFRHMNFIDKNGNSRIHKYWNQADVIYKPPSGFDYGRMITNTDFNEALRYPEPGKFIKYIPSISHGTHVTDIACGNGSTGKHGIAPNADILGVHLGITEKNKGDLGDSVSILEAIDFMSRSAGKNPLVINLSVGAHGGHHTGKSLVERGIDNFLERNPDRVLCQSCGNYRSSSAHANGRIAPGKEVNLSLITKKKDWNTGHGDELEIWYHGEDILRMELTPPGLLPVKSYFPGKTVKFGSGGFGSGSIYHRINEPNTGLNLINIFLDPLAPAGIWKIKLTGWKVVDGRFHCWIERNDSSQAIFIDNDTEKNSTVNTICNGYNTISVGAYDAGSTNFKLAEFSSCGPTFDGRSKPDIVAPGIKITAAFTSANKDRVHCELGTMSGTSMASPHVTGTAALMLSEFKHPINIHDFKRIFFTATDEIPFPQADINGIGNGKLNIPKAVNIAKNNLAK